MKFNLHNPYELQQYKEYCNKLVETCKKADYGFVEIKRLHPQRSKPQNSYLHVILAFFASECGYTIEDVKHRFYKLTCNRDLFVEKKVNKRGQEIEYVKSSKELDKAEMTLSIERFRNWSVSNGGPYIPSPEEHEALFYAQKQIDQSQEFI